MQLTYITYGLGKGSMYIAFVERLKVAYYGSTFHNKYLIRILLIIVLCYIIWTIVGPILFVNGQWDIFPFKQCVRLLKSQLAIAIALAFTDFLMSGITLFLFIRPLCLLQKSLDGSMDC